jgi:spore coat protein CotH
VRDKLGTDVFAEAGFAAPATAFYRVYVDHGDGPVYFGLYTAIELPSDKAFLRTHFADDDGNLYKPELSGSTATGQPSAFASFDSAALGKQNHEEAADFSDVRALYDALHADRADLAAWRAGLERWLDVDGFVRWLAYNTVIQDWDTYGVMAHNYYLYGVPSEGGRLRWIPWDHTFAFQSANTGLARPLSLAMDEVGDAWPLIRWVLDDPSYRASYDRYVEEAATTVYEPGRAAARFAAARALIEPYVTGADGEQPGFTHLANPAAFSSAHQQLAQHPAERLAAVRAYLAR